jgi:hypothetical protein
MLEDDLSAALARERIAELRRQADAARLARAARQRRQTRRRLQARRERPVPAGSRQPA